MKKTSEDSFKKNFFSKINVAKFRVRLICGCGLSAGVYGTFKGLNREKIW